MLLLQTNKQKNRLGRYPEGLRSTFLCKPYSISIFGMGSKEKSIFPSHFLNTYFKNDYGMLWNGSVPLRSPDFNLKEISGVQACLWAPKLVPWQTPLSAVYEYQRRIILQTPQLGSGVVLPCTPPLVTKNIHIKERGCRYVLISKDNVSTSSHWADLQFSAQAVRMSQQDSTHQTSSTTKCLSGDNGPVGSGGNRFSWCPSVI